MSIRSIVPTARSGSTGKVVSAREAVRLIRIGNTVAIGGFFEIGLALEVIHELGTLFESTDEESAAFGRPRDLTLVFCVSPGDWASGGANRLAQPGLVKRIIGGHWSAVPALYQLVAGNQVEGYNMPLGPMSHLYRDIAAGKPGHLSRVGLGTFADPRFGGGKLNEMTTEDLVELVEISRGVPVLQGFPGQCGDRSRHHRRPGRQHHDGAGGADLRHAVGGDGGAQLRGAGDRAGGAARGGEQP